MKGSSFYDYILSVFTSCEGLQTSALGTNDKVLSRYPYNVSEMRYIPAIKPYITLRYPLKHPTYCSQGNVNLSGSHSHDNILYGIDFLTPPDQQAGDIYAAHDGVAYIYNECEYRKNDHKYSNVDGCGSGYGNHVRIVHPNGYLTIYAHLSYITVKHKSHVLQGEKIGVEGLSGNAGNRHLHFGLHLPDDMSKIEEEEVGYTGVSIPFKMKFMIEGKEYFLPSTKIPCNDNLEAALLAGIE